MQLPIHPHACGAETCWTRCCIRQTGSSPRTWGRGEARRLEPGQRRFIPTHVGQSSPPFTKTGSWTVHPHARGAESRNISMRRLRNGSSPRTWGRGQRESQDGREYRFIPTHVGQRSWPETRLRISSVHPHARGAEFPDPAPIGTQNGSSPRTWGRVTSLKRYLFDTRFIPTHVGQSLEGCLLERSRSRYGTVAKSCLDFYVVHRFFVLLAPAFFLRGGFWCPNQREAFPVS